MGADNFREWASVNKNAYVSYNYIHFFPSGTRLKLLYSFLHDYIYSAIVRNFGTGFAIKYRYNVQIVRCKGEARSTADILNGH